MSDLSVALESIRACFAGVFPTQFATCSPDGTPNVIAVSLVHYVDSERVAVSRQFLRKTSDNVEANSKAQLFVTDPESFAEYRLDTEFLHTETEGPAFEAAKANLDAVASQSGMSDVFRLRGVDIHRVIRCEAVGHELEAARRPAGEPDALRPLDEFVRRLGLCADYEELTRAALHALEDLFGVAYSILLLADAEGGGLFATASLVVLLGEGAADAGRAPTPNLAAAIGSSPAASGPDHRRLWATWEIDAQPGRAPFELSPTHGAGQRTPTECARNEGPTRGRRARLVAQAARCTPCR